MKTVLILSLVNTSSADVEAEWDDYQAQLKKLGYDEVLVVMQSAYERQYGN